MTTDHQQTVNPQLRPIGEFGRSTIPAFRTLFETFWFQCGYAHAPDDRQIMAYWEKLETIPEKFLIDMFDAFIRGRCDRCPPVDAMADRCREEMRSYAREYKARTGEAAVPPGPRRDERYGRELMGATAALFRAGLMGAAYQSKLREIEKALQEKYPICE